MRLPGFTAEHSLGAPVFRYVTGSSGAARGGPGAGAPAVTPQTSWQNCSDDGRLCYYCNDDTGICICNWFYDGVWYATTDCGGGFG